VAKRKTNLAIAPTPPPPRKLDFGCGANKTPGFEGVDMRPVPGVDHVVDLRTARWPWDDNSVAEARACHLVEHFTAPERIHFVNELYRVLVPGGTCQLVTPHWAGSRAYGDLTHQWPPVSEFWFYYLDRGWREQWAAHNDGYTCDFLATWGYTLHPAIAARNQEYQQHATNFFKEACHDLVATLTKR